jgi:hypothetical protein
VATGVPAIQAKKDREPMPMITPVDVHKWRDEWRKAHGNGKKLWGNEK